MSAAINAGRVMIFDTTLRDGEQSPGASMNLAEKCRIAEQLAKLGVDVIEAGFPAASEGDFAAVRAVAQTVSGSAVAGLARCHLPDIDRAFAALEAAKKPRIHTFLATSPIHREFKLRMTKEEVLKRTEAGVRHARSLCPDVEFSAEDAARTEPEFLAMVLETAIAAGASTVNIPDTVGYTVPAVYSDLITYLRDHVSNIDQAVISVHCHNDLGLAVANSLAAVEAGARQIECTINGIGERAGNAALEEIVMALRTRKDYFGLETNIDSRQLYPTSRLLTEVTGLLVQRNKAVVGKNAFAHEAGIHQHGVLQNKETYEIMRPEDVGVPCNQLVLGKHSGRHAFRKWCDDRGFQIEETRFEEAFEGFKRLADHQKEVFEDDLLALVMGLDGDENTPWQMVSLQISAGTVGLCSAAVTMTNAESSATVEEAACGTGPVDAMFRAIARATNIPLEVKSFRLHNTMPGNDAPGEVRIEVKVEDEEYRGRAISTDIIEGTGQALIGILNRHLRKASAVVSEASV